MKKPGLTRIALLAALLSGWAWAEQPPGNAAPPLSSIVSGVETAQAQGQNRTAYQVVRDYRLSGANNSSSNSEVLAQLDFFPPNERSYRIQKSVGSGHGEEVVRKILDKEVQANDDQLRGAAVTRDNYDFSYLGQASFEGHPCYRLGLTPKRRAKDLVSGEAWVDQHTFQVRQIDGELAKTPSWWLKKVHVKMVFADVQGNWLQTNVEAVADVRIFGPHTLTAHLVDYRGADVLAMKTAPVNARAVATRGRRRPRKADPAYSAVLTR